ncbi:RES family NAD+ phosphorylase [Methylocaldum sp. GT1BB]
MVGEVEPLKALQEGHSRAAIIQRIINEYPLVELDESRLFYRIRKAPKVPTEEAEYDTPPTEFLGTGRLDSTDLPVMYGSQDLEVCVHECRVTAEDEIYVASLAPTRTLKLLDLSYVLPEEHVTEFDSLDMAVHMLFLAGKHSYPISREIAKAAHVAGYDGLIYSSYFSLLRTGSMPFEAAYGISYRRFPQMREYEQAKSIPNFALFGRPIAGQKVTVRCINKLVLSHVNYGFHFGPVGV